MGELVVVEACQLDTTVVSSTKVIEVYSPMTTHRPMGLALIVFRNTW